MNGDFQSNETRGIYNAIKLHCSYRFDFVGKNFTTNIWQLL